MKLVLAIAVITLNAQATLAQSRGDADSVPTLVTSGFGEVHLRPTRAVATFTVASRAGRAAEASSTNGAIVRALANALDRIKQPEDSVVLVGVGVQPYQNPQNGDLRGYQASAMVRFILRDLDRLGDVLDVGLSAGATALPAIEYRADSTDAARRSALALAVAHARSDAETVARASGVALGALLRVTTSTEPRPMSLMAGRVDAIMVSGATGGVPITPQDIVVTASVTTTWRLLAAR